MVGSAVRPQALSQSLSIDANVLQFSFLTSPVNPATQSVVKIHPRMIWRIK